MTQYEIVDAICDAVIPMLLLTVICLCLRRCIVGQRRSAAVLIALTILGLTVSYGIMAVDNAILLWPSLGMDYSTHTAVAAVACLVLAFALNRFAAFGLVFLAYCAAMRFQNYHTVADMLSTAAVIATLVLPAALFARKQAYLAMDTGDGYRQ